MDCLLKLQLMCRIFGRTRMKAKRAGGLAEQRAVASLRDFVRVSKSDSYLEVIAH
jgi:hypothetical protein